MNSKFKVICLTFFLLCQSCSEVAQLISNVDSELLEKINSQSFVLRKQTNKPFTICNFTDIHFAKDNLEDEENVFAKDTIDYCLEKTKPDIITITGDITSGNDEETYQNFIDLFSNYKYAWSPILGNHDYESDIPIEKIGSLFEQEKNCLFKLNDLDMGVGNYVIRIEDDNSQLLKALFMMDTHQEAEDGGYDHLRQNQIDWYVQMTKDLSTYYAKPISSVVFTHIPLYEYQDAYDYWETNEFDPSIGFGEKREEICSPKTSNHFFEILKENGTTDYICGHDHVNNFSVLYKGVRLTYAIKTGCAVYYDSTINGCLIIRIGDTGNLDLEDCFYNAA